MADIFISYASEDRSRAEPLAKALEDQGWSVWWDRIIPPGKSFDQVIQEAITEAKCVIVLWSKQSILSDWVKEEATIGKQRQILVPAKIDSVDPPLGFGLLQAADLTDWDSDTSHAGFEGFLRAISDIVGPPPQQEKGEQVAEIPDSSSEQQSEVQHEGGEIPHPTQLHSEPVKVQPSEPEPDATANTEPKFPEHRKTRKALKFGVITCVIVLLIVGIWWSFFQQQVKEVRQEIEKLNSQALNLKNAVAELDKPEQIEELFKQRDTLNHQAESLSEQTTKVGLESQLEKLQDRLKQVQIQLANKEKELIAALQKAIKNSIGMKFVLIQAGSFNMGSPSNEHGRGHNEKYHEVRISRPFYLQTTEVSQAQWERVMEYNPSKFKDCGDDCPVERVSWNDAQKFMEKLNQMEGINKYRLPTEAEWEYACRAGTNTEFSFGEDAGKLDEYANYYNNATRPPRAVGKEKPNAWGLYDMHGNVWEWCQDWYGDYPSNSVADPKGPDKGEGRVMRGGSWNDVSKDVRSAKRVKHDPGGRGSNIGFRVARDF